MRISNAQNNRRTDIKVGVVLSRYHKQICSNLLEGAHRAFADHNMASDDCVMVRVPGAFEVPSAMELLVRKEALDSIVALGCIVRGETFNFELICHGLIQGIESVRARYQVGVGYGILTVDHFNQAQARSRLDDWNYNKGYEATATAIEMARLLKVDCD